MKILIILKIQRLPLCATDLAAIEVLQTRNNGLLITTIDSDTNDIKTDMAAIEVLLTSANTDHGSR